MRLATAPPEWLEGLIVELTEIDLLAELAPGFVKLDLRPAAQGI
ncbi:MAG TPA: hypothetical protein VHJ82_09945 [Actinomycetota bacterium]|nr:hypothetical protein [Actinomycetota bacterium]